MKDKYEIDSRQKELINKYYEVDEDNKLVCISFYYSKASELFSKESGTKIPQFSKEELSKLNEIIQTIPLGYKIDISYEIEDYETYSPSYIMESFNDALELSQFGVRKSNRQKWMISTIMIIIGIILLSLMIIGRNDSFFGQGIKAEIIEEIIDIAAWVFIWEAVSLLFLEPSVQLVFGLRIKKRVNSFSLYKKGEKEALAQEKSNELFGRWKDESLLKKIGKGLILFSSSAFFVLSFYTLYGMIKGFTLVSSDNLVSVIVGSIIAIFSIVINISASLGGFAKYSSKNNFFSRFAGIYVSVQVTLLVLVLILSIISQTFEIVFLTLYSSVFSIAYVAGYFIDKYTK